MNRTTTRLLAGAGISGLLVLGGVGLANAQTDDTVPDDTTVTEEAPAVTDDTTAPDATTETPADDSTDDSTPADEARPDGGRGRAGCDDEGTDEDGDGSDGTDTTEPAQGSLTSSDA